MSKNKYSRIFSPQMEGIVFIILQIFFATRAGLKIGEYLVNGKRLSLKGTRKNLSNPERIGIQSVATVQFSFH